MSDSNLALELKIVTKKKEITGSKRSFQSRMVLVVLVIHLLSCILNTFIGAESNRWVICGQLPGMPWN